MTWLIAFLCIIPTACELYNDRNGENKKGKVKDTVILLVVVGLIAGLSYWLGQSPVATILLILGIRVMFFDYAIQYILIKNKIIVGHWFTYNGQTSYFDRIVSKIPPIVRLWIRLALFGTSMAYFLLS